MQLSIDFSTPARDEPTAPSKREAATPSTGDYLPRAPAPPTGRARLEARIRDALELPVELVVTDNQRTMLSTRRGQTRIEVRLHHMFLDAPPAIIEELLCYLSDGDPRSSGVLERFVDNNRARIKRRRRRIRLEPRGEHHDLTAILTAVKATDFPEESSPDITWGRRHTLGRRRRRRSIRLGTYTPEVRLIRIHRALDQAFVPEWFVSFVVFHEFLHHVIPAETRGTQLVYHSDNFRARERLHPDYDRANRWERKHLDQLLSYRG